VKPDPAISARAVLCFIVARGAPPVRRR
jgi:hypothetical protein